MKVKITPKAILIPTISLFLICLVVTALLALTNNVTADKIAENEQQSKQESMFSVLPDADHFEQVFEGVDDMYYGVDKNGDVIGYAISTAVQGYGGQVKVMTGINDGKIVAVDVFYNDEETPGLGKNTSNESFRDQYKGLNADSDIQVSKDSTDGQTVDAVTSATISSRAVTKAVNRADRLYTIYTATNRELSWEELNRRADDPGYSETVTDLSDEEIEKYVIEADPDPADSETIGGTDTNVEKKEGE